MVLFLSTRAIQLANIAVNHPPRYHEIKKISSSFLYQLYGLPKLLKSLGTAFSSKITDSENNGDVFVV